MKPQQIERLLELIPQENLLSISAEFPQLRIPQKAITQCQKRKEFLRRFFDGENMTVLTEELGVSRSTAYLWIARKPKKVTRSEPNTSNSQKHERKDK